MKGDPLTDLHSLLRADRGQSATPIHLVDKNSFESWKSNQPASRRDLLEAMHFDGKTGYQYAILPPVKGEEGLEVVSTVANVQSLSPWCLAKLGEALPAGTYRLAKGSPGPAALGWLLAQHRFDRYRTKPSEDRGPRLLLTPDAAAVDETVRLAQATLLVRDLVDTPAADLGPAELEEAVRAEAKRWHGTVRVTGGKALEKEYPMVAAVGGGAVPERAPRMIEVEWGKAGAPLVAIVGKGIVFDTGGLDIKPAAGMRLMKKDMGGAAHALALAGLIAEARLPVRLHLLIPAAENAVSGGALRPGDIVVSRSGKQVEIDNTDAEGRLVLADALTRAGEEKPDLIIDFATLTGAARVALGPDLPAMFSNDEDLADQLRDASKSVEDPIWRMPLWDAYDEMLKSDLADLSNSADSPFAGAVTAALFLRRFVPDGVPWAHFDTFAWRPAAKPGRPKGGEACGLRSAFAALGARFS